MSHARDALFGFFVLQQPGVDVNLVVRGIKNWKDDPQTSLKEHLLSTNVMSKDETERIDKLVSNRVTFANDNAEACLLMEVASLTESLSTGRGTVANVERPSRPTGGTLGAEQYLVHALIILKNGWVSEDQIWQLVVGIEHDDARNDERSYFIDRGILSREQYKRLNEEAANTLRRYKYAFEKCILGLVTQILFNRLKTKSRFDRTTHKSESDAGVRRRAEAKGITADADKVVGIGGQGVLFSSVDTNLETQVVVKEILPELRSSATAKNNLIKEAKLTASLAGKGITPVYAIEYGDDGIPTYAMQYVTGFSLADLIQRHHQDPLQGRKPKGDPPPEKEARPQDAETEILEDHPTPGSKPKRSAAPIQRETERVPYRDLSDLIMIFTSICDTISRAHDRNVIHLDLKPVNVRIDEYNDAVVLDWGLAEKLEKRHQIKISGDSEKELEMHVAQALGTPNYMAPEQADGTLSKKGDVFGLGAILYEILSGSSPIAVSSTHWKEDVRHAKPKPLRKLNKKIPAALEAICQKAIAPNRKERYPSVKALKTDVENWIKGDRVNAFDDEDKKEPLTEFITRNARKKASLLSTIAAALLVGLLVSVVLGATISQRNAVITQVNRKVTEERDRVDGLFRYLFSSIEMESDIMIGDPNMIPNSDLNLLASHLNDYEQFLIDGDANQFDRHRLANGYFAVGRVYEVQRKHESAGERFIHAKELLDQHRKKLTDSSEARSLDVTISMVETAIGRTALARSNLDEAEVAVQNSVNIRKKLIEQSPDDPELNRLLANAMMNLGVIAARRNQLESAGQLMQQGMAKVQPMINLAQRSGNFDTQFVKSYRTSAKIYYNQSIVEQKQGNLENAEELATSGDECFQDLIHTFNSKQAQDIYYMVRCRWQTAEVTMARSNQMNDSEKWKEVLKQSIASYYEVEGWYPYLEAIFPVTWKERVRCKIAVASLPLVGHANDTALDDAQEDFIYCVNTLKAHWAESKNDPDAKYVYALALIRQASLWNKLEKKSDEIKSNIEAAEQMFNEIKSLNSIPGIENLGKEIEMIRESAFGEAA